MSSRFLALPAEIRIEIYRHAFGWPDFNIVSKKAEQELKLHSSPNRPCHMKTPSLLILNRQISWEAQDVPFEVPLVIDAPLPFIMHAGRPISITEVICKVTLQRLRYVVLDLNLDFDTMQMVKGVDCWLELVKELLDIWNEKNCLKRLEVRVNYLQPNKIRGWTFQEAHFHRCVMDMLSQLRRFGECVPVKFVGKRVKG